MNAGTRSILRQAASSTRAYRCQISRLRPSSHQANSTFSFSTTTTPTPIQISSSDETSTPLPPSYLNSISELSKFRLSSLVVATTSAGFLSFGAPASYPALLAACAGTALCSSSASTWNQIFEVDRDAKMKRTRNRPLPAGIVSANAAKLLGTATGVAGVSTLLFWTDVTTACLGAGNVFLYAGVYTYLKPRSEVNTWVGAVVGAIPPVMGWTAAGGSLMDVEAVILGSTLFLWQFPHFFALSWMHRVDYARGGFQMVPCNDTANGDRTSALITRYTWYLSTMPVVASVLGVTSSMFAVEGVVLNAYALYVAKKFDKDRSNANARKVFLTSLWYLPCWLMLFILHSETWRNEETDKLKDDEEFELGTFIQRYIVLIRNKGREMCVHETVISPNRDQGGQCPLSVGMNQVDAVKDNGLKTAEVAIDAVIAMDKTADE